MKGYYGIWTGREDIDMFFLPWNLYIRGDNKRFYYDWEPNLIDELNIAFIDISHLLDRGWSITEVDVPLYFVKAFQKLSLEKVIDENKMKGVIREIYDYVSESLDDKEDFYFKRGENIREYYEDDEDYYDDWWKRGENPTWE